MEPASALSMVVLPAPVLPLGDALTASASRAESKADSSRRWQEANQSLDEVCADRQDAQ
jgi:hypothetical protein